MSLKLCSAMDMIINHYVILIGVGRPWDSHKLENIGVCPRVGGRVFFSVLETVNEAYGEEQVQVLER